ncbi:hypothetical protein BC567DRAFT_226898 [Phyllosticta citribraziliensis]
MSMCHAACSIAWQIRSISNHKSVAVLSHTASSCPSFHVAHLFPCLDIPPRGSPFSNRKQMSSTFPRSSSNQVALDPTSPLCLSIQHTCIARRPVMNGSIPHCRKRFEALPSMGRSLHRNPHLKCKVCLQRPPLRSCPWGRTDQVRGGPWVC